MNEKISEMNVEEFEKYVEEIIDKRIKQKPMGISLETFWSIVTFIKNNIVVTKDELISKFGTLSNPRRFFLFKKSITEQNEFAYIWFHGKKYPARFVYIKYDKSPQFYAIKFFEETEWGKPIFVNCPDPELKTEIYEWIVRIFKDVIVRSNYSPYPMKGSLKDRRRRVVKQ
jgi:hypothetical protein